MAKEELVSVIASMWEVDEDVDKVKFVYKHLLRVKFFFEWSCHLDKNEISHNSQFSGGRQIVQWISTEVANKSMQRVTARVEDCQFFAGPFSSPPCDPLHHFYWHEMIEELRSSLRDEGLELQELRSATSWRLDIFDYRQIIRNHLVKILF